MSQHQHPLFMFRLLLRAIFIVLVLMAIFRSDSIHGVVLSIAVAVAGLIDTAADLCAACVRDTDGGERGRSVLDLGKGHAEHLMGMIVAALREAGCGFSDLDAVAVSVGPATPL